jgi:xanthine dehydrogenase accessory factor
MNSFEQIIERAAELQAQGQAYVLATVIKTVPPASCNPGDKALVTAEGNIHGWIGGGCAQPAVFRAARRCLEDGKPRTIRITPERSGEEMLDDVMEFAMPCQSGGTIELFVDPVSIRSELVVLGQSPVAEALVAIAPQIGLRVTWLADLEREVKLVRVLPIARVAEIAPGAHVVVATQGLHDIAQLKLALGLQARHVAFVASRRKAQVVKESLIEAGFDKAAVEAIEAPAGYPIDAKTPEEIALSILAGLVARSRARAAPQAPAEMPHTEAAPSSCCETSNKYAMAEPHARHAAHGSCCSGD